MLQWPNCEGRLRRNVFFRFFQIWHSPQVSLENCFQMFLCVSVCVLLMCVGPSPWSLIQILSTFLKIKNTAPPVSYPSYFNFTDVDERKSSVSHSVSQGVVGLSSHTMKRYLDKCIITKRKQKTFVRTEEKGDAT